MVCQQNVCSLCARLEHEKLYCERHVPIVQIPEEPKRRCFIATAAYGTPMAKEIDALRNFRDQKLQKTTIGQKLVTTYYTISPSIANIIDRNEALRKTTRSCIDPLIHLLKKRGY